MREDEEGTAILEPLTHPEVCPTEPPRIRPGAWALGASKLRRMPGLPRGTSGVQPGAINSKGPGRLLPDLNQLSSCPPTDSAPKATPPASQPHPGLAPKAALFLHRPAPQTRLRPLSCRPRLSPACRPRLPAAIDSVGSYFLAEGWLRFGRAG